MSDVTPGARPRALGLLAATAVALVAAVAGGSAAGGAVWAGRPTDTNDQWSDLGHGLAALLVGFVVGGLVYVVGVVAGVRWVVPRGRRLVTTLAVLGGTAAVAVAAGSVAGSADRGGVPVLGLVVAIVVLAAVVAGIGVVLGAVDRGTAAWIAVAAVAGYLLVAFVGDLRAGGVADRERAARYERSGAPLALVGGRDLTLPADGWDVVDVAQGWTLDDVAVSVAVPPVDGGGVDGRVTLVMARDHEPRPCEHVPASDEGACVVLGRRDGGGDGDEIRGDPITGFDGVTGYAAVWVDVPGGSWTIRGADVPQPVDEAAAVAVLTALEPVDAGEFTAAT